MQQPHLGQGQPRYSMPPHNHMQGHPQTQLSMNPDATAFTPGGQPVGYMNQPFRPVLLPPTGQNPGVMGQPNFMYMSPHAQAQAQQYYHQVQMQQQQQQQQMMYPQQPYTPSLLAMQPNTFVQQQHQPQQQAGQPPMPQPPRTIPAITPPTQPAPQVNQYHPMGMAQQVNPGPMPSGLYYPHQHQQQFPQPRPQLPPASATRTRPNALKIVDPNTQEEIDLTAKPPESSKSASQPPKKPEENAPEAAAATTQAPAPAPTAAPTLTMPPPPAVTTPQETTKAPVDQIDAVGKKLEELSMKPDALGETSKPLSEIHSEATPSKAAAAEAEPMFEPVSPTPLPDDSKSSEDDFEAKSKNSRKKQNAGAKRAELNQKSSSPINDDAFKTPTATTSSSAVPTPEERTSKSPESVLTPEPTNHVNDVQPEVTSTIPGDTNHVSEDGEDEVGSEKGEVAENNSSSKTGSQIKLKYDYKEDQWSPINQEGKKQYDRDFLMKLQNDPLSKERPPNLPPLDIVKDKSINSGIPSKDWIPTPHFVKPVISRSSVTKKPSRDGRYDKRQSSSQPPKVIDVKIEKVELHQTENAWKPTKFADNTNGEPDTIEVLLRKARAILNKLCPQKFDTLVNQFNELQIDKEDKLEACMELVFEKAVDEPGFSEAYARMCEVLQRKQATVETNAQKPALSFRKLLVTRCQKEFEQDYLHGLDRSKYEAELAEAGDDEAKRKTIQANWEEKEMKARRRSLGNIRFIGELYKLKMLTARIMHECIKKLIKTTDEESLECMCRLLTTVGKDLEQETNERISRASSVEEAKRMGLAPFDFYFADIDRIIGNKQISSRVRFMLQDLVDLRKNNWKPRREAAGPKTIDQIHQEAEREQTQIQLLNQITPGRGGGGGGGGGRDGGGLNDRKKSGRGGNAASDDGWTNVPTKSSQRGYDKIDTTKISNLAQRSGGRPFDADTIQLGPSRSAWTSGSGSMRRVKEEPPQEQTRNKFAMLNTHDGGGYSSMPPPPFESSRPQAGGPSRSIGVPGRSSRGPSVENDRRRTFDPRPPSKMPEAAGPTMSLGPNIHGRHVPDSRSEASDMLEQTRKLKGKCDMSTVEIENQSKMLLEEFLHGGSETDAVETLCTYFHPSAMEQLVENLINGVLERTQAACRKVGQLLARLIKEHILLKKQFEAGLKPILEITPDLVVDIPKVWDYIGELIAPLIATGAIPMSFVVDNCVPNESPYPEKYLAGVLSAIVQSAGADKAADLWKSARMNVETFVAKDRVKGFAESNKFDFLLGSSSGGTLSHKEIHSELTRLLDPKIKLPNEACLSWIEENLGKQKREGWFIRILMTAIAESSISNDMTYHREIMDQRLNVLRVCVDGSVELQKQALYALQHLMHRLEHPNRVLFLIFECLHDGDVISDDAFFAWEDCKEAAESEGKGVAVSSTIKFFTLLREIQDESDEENVDTDNN